MNVMSASTTIPTAIKKRSFQPNAPPAANALTYIYLMSIYNIIPIIAKITSKRNPCTKLVLKDFQ